MKIVKIISLIFLCFFSCILSLKNMKSTNSGFYPGATDQILLTVSTPLINMDDASSQIINSCLKLAFASKYEYQERDLWAKIEKVNNKPTEVYKREFWFDFFSNIKDSVKDPKGDQVCATLLKGKLKNEGDFNDPKIQKQIRDSMGGYNAKVAKLVADRQKTFITSSISTHRYSRAVSPDVFSKLNQRANLK